MVDFYRPGHICMYVHCVMLDNNVYQIRVLKTFKTAHIYTYTYYYAMYVRNT